MTTYHEQEANRRDAERRLLMDTITATPPTSRRRTPLVVGTTLAVAGLLAVGTVAVVTSSHPTEQSAASFDLRSFPSPSSDGASDFVVFSSPDDFAASSPLIIRGVIDTVIESDPSPESSGQLPHAVLVIRDVSVVKGELDPRNDGTMHVALPAYLVGANGASLAYWNELFPSGTEVVAYPGPVSSDASGESSYMLLHPQGLAVQTPGSTDVAWPLLLDEKPGRLEDALPGGHLIGGLN